MSDITNHQKVRLLKMVRQVIDTGIDGHQVCYLCPAFMYISFVEERNLSDEEKAFLNYMTYGYVPTKLGGCYSLDLWVRYEAKPKVGDVMRLKEANDIGGMMRLAWIDRMIFELETKMVLP